MAVMLGILTTLAGGWWWCLADRGRLPEPPPPGLQTLYGLIAIVGLLVTAAGLVGLARRSKGGSPC